MSEAHTAYFSKAASQPPSRQCGTARPAQSASSFCKLHTVGNGCRCSGWNLEDPLSEKSIKEPLSKILQEETLSNKSFKKPSQKILAKESVSGKPFKQKPSQKKNFTRKPTQEFFLQDEPLRKPVRLATRQKLLNPFPFHPSLPFLHSLPTPPSLLQRSGSEQLFLAAKFGARCFSTKFAEESRAPLLFSKVG